jgi:hypothetical protein
MRKHLLLGGTLCGRRALGAAGALSHHITEVVAANRRSAMPKLHQSSQQPGELLLLCTRGWGVGGGGLGVGKGWGGSIAMRALARGLVLPCCQARAVLRSICWSRDVAKAAEAARARTPNVHRVLARTLGRGGACVAGWCLEKRSTSGPDRAAGVDNRSGVRSRQGVLAHRGCTGQCTTQAAPGCCSPVCGSCACRCSRQGAAQLAHMQLLLLGAQRARAGSSVTFVFAQLRGA